MNLSESYIGPYSFHIVQNACSRAMFILKTTETLLFECHCFLYVYFKRANTLDLMIQQSREDYS